MGSSFSLQAQVRDTKQNINQLRASGKLPATMYGRTVDALSIQVDAKTFAEIFEEAGQTGLVELEIDGKKYSVLIHQYSIHPLKRHVVNVEFYHVLLTEKVTTQIPVHLTGQSPADKKGLYLSHDVNELEIEALPQDLVSEITVDISALEEVGDSILVSQLNVPGTITVLTSGDETVVKVQAPEEEVETEDEETEGLAMPELIGRKDDEEQEEA